MSDELTKVLDYLKSPARNCREGFEEKKNPGHIGNCHSAKCSLGPLKQRDYKGVISEAYTLCNSCGGFSPRVYIYQQFLKQNPQKHI